MRRGTGDPTYRPDPADPDGTIWRTMRAPTGPAAVRIELRPEAGEVVGTAWGPGGEWALDALPGSLGAGDRDADAFRPGHRLLAELRRRHPGWRVPCTTLVLEALVPAILEQKVTATEAWRAWRCLLQWYGEPAPGPAPAGMRVVPPERVWRLIPSWDWHRAGVDAKRSRAVIGAAAVAGRVEQSVRLQPEEADRRLRSLPGVGAWTSAEVRQRALGDPDAVSVGDLHLPGLVGHALIGRRVDDDGMLELLAPYGGHRYRAVRLIELSGLRPERRAPRFAPRDFRSL